MQKSFVIVILSILFIVSLAMNIGLLMYALPQITQQQVEDVIPEVKEYTLADAITLLDQPEYAVAGRAINEQTYWVWSEVPGESAPAAEQAWLVDLASGTTSLISDDFYGPAGAETSYDTFVQKYLSVTYNGGWEGLYTTSNIIFDRDSGEWVGTSRIESGQEAFLENENITLEIDYLPEDLCDDITFEVGEGVREASGISVNGEEYPFTTPMEVTCLYDAMGGYAVHENLSATFSESIPGFRVYLAEGHVDIPLNLDVAEMRIVER